MEGVAARRFRFGLRSKLAAAALALLALPWAGARYVGEVERFLLDSQERSLLSIARAAAAALHGRPELFVALPGYDEALKREAEAELRRLAGAAAPPEGEALARASSIAARPAREELSATLRGVSHGSVRVWVVNRGHQVLAIAGSLARPESAAEPDSLWRRALGWLVRRPTERFAETLPDDVLATGRDVAAALQGSAATRTRATPDARAVVVSAAHPVWDRDSVIGAVVVEETTNPIVSLTSDALERLLLLTLAVFVIAVVLLLGYATRLSQRIRRLRDEAEAAIDAGGRVTRLAAGSGAGDEIGDLSRSFSAVLKRLAQHQDYLESLSGRLSHELRTPIAVVRSSLENVKLAGSPGEATRYIERAEEGLARLNTILQRMTEAARLEQGLRGTERERYDLAPVVAGCVEGYRVAYPKVEFELVLPGRAMPVEGSADGVAQMLDKLVENAVDFATDARVRIALEERAGHAELTVENRGAPLPGEIRARLFDSMVSLRGAPGARGPHLGLGLYVARLVAEFHGGSIEAADRAAGDGVVLRVRLPIAWR